jgi:conjugal transfer/entry exclusion protein
MRSGSFFGGLVFLIIGVAGLFVYFPNYQQLTSTLGQLGRAIDPQLQQTYNQVLMYVIGSAAAILIGLALLIYGAASKPTTPTQNVK